MPAQQQPPPPAPGVVQPVRGIEHYHEAVKGAGLDHVQLDRGTLTGLLGHVNLGGVVLGVIHADKAARTRGAYNPAGYNLGVMLELPQPGRFWGSESGEGSILIGPPQVEADSITPGPFGCAYLVPQPAIWESVVTAMAPRSADLLLRNRGIIQPPPAFAGSLTRRFREVVHLVFDGQPFPAGAAAAVREELLGLVARAATVGTEVVEPCGRFFRHRRIVQRCEDYLRGRIDEAVYVRELCQHCDVSERTLQYAFREVLGLSPMVYLRRRRLSAIRSELLAADPAPGLVTRAALRWGFWHLGEFAAAYKDLFGESPGETLRQRRPHPQSPLSVPLGCRRGHCQFTQVSSFRDFVGVRRPS